MPRNPARRFFVHFHSVGDEQKADVSAWPCDRISQRVVVTLALISAIIVIVAPIKRAGSEVFVMRLPCWKIFLGIKNLNFFKGSAD
jgi:hypothetical protein